MTITAQGLSQYLKIKALDACFGVAGMLGRARGPALHYTPRINGRTLIILLEGIGDSLAFTPALRAIRRSYPRVHIDLLVNNVSYQVYRDTPHADGFIFSGNGAGEGRGIMSLLGALRQNSYRVAITPSLLFRHISLTYLSGAALRAGFDVGGRGIALNIPLTLDRGKPRIHCYLDLVRALGAGAHGDRMEIRISHADESKARELLRRGGADESRPRIAIHPGTRQAVNDWPPDRYARLADRLVERYGASIVLTGSDGDRVLVRKISSLMRTEAVSLAGETTLSELAAVFRRCDLTVCPDTGAMHLACAVGAPTVVIMGGRNAPAEWGPLSTEASVLRREVPCSPCHRSVCMSGDVQCMRAITVDEVMEVVHERLTSRGR
jgi:lipopolysaccharide heptosyltransferase II